MGSVKKAFKKAFKYTNPFRVAKKSVNYLTGADKQEKALEAYKQSLEDVTKYDPSKPLEGTGSVDQGAGGARDDLAQAMQQGSGGNVGSVVSSGSANARAQYFKKKNNKRGTGMVNF